MAYTAIDDAGSYFNTKLYTGTGASNAQTGVGFQPDFTWIKNIDAADFHVLTDAVRGVTDYLVSNDTDAETTNAESLKTFDSDGFTVGTMNEVNTNTEAFVAWNWKANGAGSANTDGSISTAATSANTTAGFSICQYTGTGANGTVGHGLGVAPKMIIFKNTNTVTNWDVYHGSLANTERIYLDTNAAKNTAAHAFNSTSPTTSVFSVGTADNTNRSSSPMIAYCFAEKQGYSKFGGYTGNGDVDGPFIYTGFRPAMVIAKRTDSSGYWRIRDNKRSPYNVIDVVLRPDTAEAEVTEDDHDFLSNGFKVRTTGPENNADGGTYLYMAFAESPFVNSNGVPTNAR